MFLSLIKMSKTLDGSDLLSNLNGVFTATAFSTGSGDFTYESLPITLTLTSDGSTNITSTFQESFYTKIGNHVMVNFAIQVSITDNTTPGAIKLQGFPTGPNLSFGTCNLAQIFPTVTATANWPVQGFVLNGEMTFFANQQMTPIETDLSQDGTALIGSISYNYTQPDL